MVSNDYTITIACSPNNIGVHFINFIIWNNDITQKNFYIPAIHPADVSARHVYSKSISTLMTTAVSANQIYRKTYHLDAVVCPVVAGLNVSTQSADSFERAHWEGPEPGARDM